MFSSILAISSNKKKITVFCSFAKTKDIAFVLSIILSFFFFYLLIFIFSEVRLSTSEKKKKGGNNRWPFVWKWINNFIFVHYLKIFPDVGFHIIIISNSLVPYSYSSILFIFKVSFISMKPKSFCASSMRKKISQLSPLITFLNVFFFFFLFPRENNSVIYWVLCLYLSQAFLLSLRQKCSFSLALSLFLSFLIWPFCYPSVWL